MPLSLDLDTLAARESEQVEWKDAVADTDDVAKTLVAFANDLQNLGGGYVVCGAREGKDPHGFPKVEMFGLDAARIRAVENEVLAKCRDRVAPSIAPLCEEIRIPGSDDRRVLVFVIPATNRAHTFRPRDGVERHFVRISRETKEARNGILRELLVRKGDVLPWDRRACPGATVLDIDPLKLRDVLQRMHAYDPARGIDEYLGTQLQIRPFVDPLCVEEPLTNILRPRNFAVLLFAREPQRFIPNSELVQKCTISELSSCKHSLRSLRRVALRLAGFVCRTPISISAQALSGVAVALSGPRSLGSACGAP